MKQYKKIISLLTLLALLALPAVGLADLPADEEPKLVKLDISAILGKIFTFIIWPVVIAFVIIMFIMAGFMFLTANGEPGKLSLARSSLAWGVVGVIVILVSFSVIATIR